MLHHHRFRDFLCKIWILWNTSMDFGSCICERPAFDFRWRCYTVTLPSELITALTITTVVSQFFLTWPRWRSDQYIAYYVVSVGYVIWLNASYLNQTHPFDSAVYSWIDVIVVVSRPTANCWLTLIVFSRNCQWTTGWETLRYPVLIPVSQPAQIFFAGPIVLTLSEQQHLVLDTSSQSTKRKRMPEFWVAMTPLDPLATAMTDTAIRVKNTIAVLLITW